MGVPHPGQGEGVTERDGKLAAPRLHQVEVLRRRPGGLDGGLHAWKGEDVEEDLVGANGCGGPVC
jgi:hypothetical protein